MLCFRYSPTSCTKHTEALFGKRYQFRWYCTEWVHCFKSSLVSSDEILIIISCAKVNRSSSDANKYHYPRLLSIVSINTSIDMFPLLTYLFLSQICISVLRSEIQSSLVREGKGNFFSFVRILLDADNCKFPVLLRTELSFGCGYLHQCLNNM